MPNDIVADIAFEAGVAAERARCAKIAEDQADEADKASSPYDSGAGYMGYREACRDIAEAIAKEPPPSPSAAEIMAGFDSAIAALKGTGAK